MSMVFLTAAYSWSQILTGDRDFFIVIIAVMLMVSVIENWRRTALLGLGVVGIVMVLFGTLVSIVRMDVDISLESLFLFVANNSWNATILPVILMIEEEWGSGFYLYGKSYFDLIISIIPSPFFKIFDIDKPINIDNPAAWFYVEGLGGMHASGVALRNYGLLGVFMQVFIWVLILAQVELRCRKSHSFWNIFLYLCLAGSLMHAVWYGLASLVNALVFYFGVYLISLIFINNSIGLRATASRIG